MKYGMPQYNWLQAFVVAFCISLSLSSCETYNFSNPLPADKKNIYEFPAVLQGNWRDDEVGEGEYIHVGKTYVELIRKIKEKIVAGLWPRLNEKNEFVYAPFSYSSFNTVLYDSLKRPVDTINNYLQRKKLIYKMTEGVLPEQGYPYNIEHDTILVQKNDTIIIDLGQNAFLRKLNNRFYVLNIKTSILGEENRWWKVIIIEIINGQSLCTWDNTDKLKKESSMFYQYKSNFYFDSEWSAEYMERLMNEKYFEADSRLKKDIPAVEK